MIALETNLVDSCRTASRYDLGELGWLIYDFSDFHFNLTIHGRSIVLKNRHQIVNIGKEQRIVSSNAARKWVESCAAQLRAQWAPVFREPIPKSVLINAAIVTYLPTRQLPDASALYEAPQDALQACTRQCEAKRMKNPGWVCRKHAGVIENDVQVCSHDGSRRLYDKNNPRVDIVLTPYRG